MRRESALGDKGLAVEDVALVVGDGVQRGDGLIGCRGYGYDRLLDGVGHEIGVASDGKYVVVGGDAGAGVQIVVRRGGGAVDEGEAPHAARARTEECAYARRWELVRRVGVDAYEVVACDNGAERDAGGTGVEYDYGLVTVIFDIEQALYLLHVLHAGAYDRASDISGRFAAVRGAYGDHIHPRRGAGYDDGAHGCGDGGDGQQGEYQSEGDLHTMLFL